MPAEPRFALLLRRISLVFMLSFSLAACSDGGGGGGGTPPAQNKPPVADAGIDLATREGESVALDGSQSADPDGTLKSYQWTVTGEPAAAIDGAASASATFVAPDVEQDTSYAVGLTVTDNKGETASDTTNVIVFRHVEGNQPPQPLAEPASATPGASVLLDGSGSLDADGSIVAYEWRQLAGPAVELAGADSAVASFQAPEAGSETALLFRLIVTDDRGERSALDVTVDVDAGGDQPPVADAGGDRQVNAGDLVQLEGANSQDPEAGALNYAWSQTGGNDFFEAMLDDPASATPSFTAPADIDAEAVLAFELTVTDLAGQESKDSVAITVRPLVAGNQLPIAVAGGPVSPVNGGFSATLLGDDSSDADGSIVAYQWTQVAGPAVTLDDANQERARFTAPFVAEETTLTFRLTVTDNLGGVAHDDVVVIVAAGESVTAIAKANGVTSGATVIEGGSIVLDGRDSVSPGGQPLTYTWEGEVVNVVVDPVNPAIARAIAPERDSDQTYGFELTVSDGTDTDTDIVFVEVKANRPPVVDAGADVTVNAGDAVTLNGNANDPEGAPLVIQWQQLAVDGVPDVALANADTFAPSFTAPADVTEPVTLQFGITVTDEDEQAAEDVVTVTVNPVVAGNQPPVAVASDQAVDEGALVTLDGSASHDPDGDNANLAFEWIQIDIPEGQQPVTLSEPNAAAPTFTAPAAAVDIALKFRLFVTDEQSAVSAPLVVTVTVRNAGEDVVPDEMVFEPMAEADLLTFVQSNQVEVSDIESPIPVKVLVQSGAVDVVQMIVSRTDGTNGGYIQTTTNAGDRIRIRTRFTDFGQAAELALVFGDPEAPDYVTSWSVAAKLDGDQDPDAASFQFPDVTDLEPGEIFDMDVLEPAGFDTTAPISVLADGASFAVVSRPSGVNMTDISPGEDFKVRFMPTDGVYGGEGTVTVTIGSASTSFNFTTRAKDETPVLSPDAIPAQTGLEPLVETTTDVAVSDFDETLTASVTGPLEAMAQLAVSTDGGTTFGEFSSSVEVSTGKVIRIRALSPALDGDGSETQHSVTLTVGVESREFVVGTRAPDRLPDAFSIPPAANAAVDAPVRSAPFTIPGIEVPVQVSLTGDAALSPVLYINGETAPQDPMAGPDDALAIEILSPDATSDTVSVTLTAGAADLGQMSADFVVTTSSTDTTPDPFGFGPKNEVAQGVLAESEAVTIQGISDSETVTVTVSGDADAAYAIRRDGETLFGPFTAEPGEVGNGDQLKVRVRASESFGTDTRAILDVGGRFAEFMVTSVADVEAPVAEITFPVNGAWFSSDDVEELHVAVKAADNDRIDAVRVNGVAATYDSAVGLWFAPIAVIAGENALQIEVNDPSGNSATDNISVTGETGVFTDVADMRWAGGLLYLTVEEGVNSRIVTVDPVTGSRATLVRDAGNLERIVLDDRNGPTTLYSLSADNVVREIDLANGVVSILSGSSQEPRFNLTSRIGLVHTAGGEHVLVARSSSADGEGIQLYEVLPNGERQEILEIPDYSLVAGFDVAGETGWLLAISDSANKAIIKLDLTDLGNIVTDIRLVTVDGDGFPAVGGTNSELRIDIFDETGEPDVFIYNRGAVFKLAPDGGSGAWVTGADGAITTRTVRGSGPQPRVVGSNEGYSGLAQDASGNLFIADDAWSMIFAIDRSTGDRSIISGLNGNIVPSDIAHVTPATSPLGVMPDGSIVMERGITDLATNDIYVPSVARYLPDAGRWEYLPGPRFSYTSHSTPDKAALEYLPAGLEEIFVMSTDWKKTGTSNDVEPGIHRLRFDPDPSVSRWVEELFSVQGDGKLPDGQVEDWVALRAVTRHPNTGELWAIDVADSRNRLWRVTEDGVRHLELIIPEIVNGMTLLASSATASYLAFSNDGRLFWSTRIDNGTSRLFAIDIDGGEVRLASEASTGLGSRDLEVDGELQFAYDIGTVTLKSIDILPDSAAEGDVVTLPDFIFPGMTVGAGNASMRSAFDPHRRRLWLYQTRWRAVYLIQPDTGEVVMLPKH